ncbi:uncharacterized protein ACIB01_016421 [Guaruba guarouba]
MTLLMSWSLAGLDIICGLSLLACSGNGEELDMQTTPSLKQDTISVCSCSFVTLYPELGGEGKRTLSLVKKMQHTNPAFLWLKSVLLVSSGFVETPSQCFLHGHWMSQSTTPPTRRLTTFCGQLENKETPSASFLHLVGCAVYGLELACIRLCLLSFFLVLTSQNHSVIISK